MSKKAVKDKSLELSIENFSKFTKVTKDNLSDFIGNGSIFIIAELKDNTLNVYHTFSSRKPFKRGLNEYLYIWEGTILKYTFRCYEDEKKEDYYEDQSNYIKYINKQIYSNNVYAIKI